MNSSNSLYNISSWDGYTFETFVGGGNKVFEIPLFQRNYSWEESSCEQIFNDIFHACIIGKPYYIGNFMYYKSSETTPKVNKFILIDGQQRITSLLLLLCAIRDLYPILNSDNEVIKNSCKGENEYKFKLKQNYNDYYDFINIMEGKREEKKSSIYDAYDTFKKLIDKDKNVFSRNVKRFYDTIKNLECIGIELNAKDTKNVQDIFEKINSTGVELSQADLIRNFLLFSESTSIQEHLHKYWKEVENIIGEKKISKYSKAYLIRYIFSDVTNDKIYFEFKAHFSGYEHESILQDFVKYSTFFSMIESQRFYEFDQNDCLKIKEYDLSDPKNEGTAKYNQLNTLKTTFSLLNKIGTDELNPFFLYLCNSLYYHDINKLNEICEFLLEFMIRYRIVQPSGGGGALSTKIRKIMKSIDDGECKMSKKAIYSLLSNKEDSEASKYPDNDEFISSLKSGVSINNARVLLYQFARRKGEELVPFNSNVTVEHIMPQGIDDIDDDNDKKWWIDNLGGNEKWQEIYNNYLNCIGNMVLVGRSLNSKMKNKPWDEKRICLQTLAMGKSALKVAKLEKWTKSQMETRNKNHSNELSQYITGPKSDKKVGSNWLL